MKFVALPLQIFRFMCALNRFMNLLDPQKSKTIDTVLDQRRIGSISMPKYITSKYGSVCPPGTIRQGDGLCLLGRISLIGIILAMFFWTQHAFADAICAGIPGTVPGQYSAGSTGAGNAGCTCPNGYSIYPDASQGEAARSSLSCGSVSSDSSAQSFNP